MRGRRETHSVNPQASTRLERSTGVAGLPVWSPLFDHTPVGDDHGRAGGAKSPEFLCVSRTVPPGTRGTVQSGLPAKVSSARVEMAKPRSAGAPTKIHAEGMLSFTCFLNRSGVEFLESETFPPKVSYRCSARDFRPSLRGGFSWSLRIREWALAVHARKICRRLSAAPEADSGLRPEEVLRRLRY